MDRIRKDIRAAQGYLLKRNYQCFLVEGQLALENLEPSIAAGQFPWMTVAMRRNNRKDFI